MLALGINASYLWVSTTNGSTWNIVEGAKMTEWNNNGTRAWYYDVTINGEGKYIMRTHPLDNAGNVNWSTYADEIMYVDRTIPTSTSSSKNISITNNPNATVTLTISGLSDNIGVSRVIFSSYHEYPFVAYNSTKTGTISGTTATCTYTLDEIMNTSTGTTNCGDGTYIFDAYIYDGAGNYKYVYFGTVLCDATRPTIGSVTGIQYKNVASGTNVPVTISNIVDANLASVQYAYLVPNATDWVYKTATNTSSTYTFNVPITVEGTYDVAVAATDIAGNQSSESPTDYWKRTTIVVDRSIPVVTFGTNGSSTYIKTAATTVTVSDVGGLVNSSLKYQWLQSATMPDEETFSKTLTNGTSSTIRNANGVWYLWVLAKDMTGNTVITKSNPFYIDNDAPTGTINIARVYGNYTNSNTLSVNLTASDNQVDTSKIKVALINGENFSLSNPNSGISWQAFATTKTIQSSSGGGLKRVYVIFKDEAGNQSIYLAQ